MYGIAMLQHRLAKRFFESAKSMDAVEIYGDFGTNTRIATVSIRVDGFTPEQVHAHMLEKYGIVCKPGLHNASRMHEALGTAATGLTRFSFGYFNTRIDVNDAIWALMDLLGLDDLYLLA
jgi:selenocysteine lyase/cysteine desulfurase